MSALMGSHSFELNGRDLVSGLLKTAVAVVGHDGAFGGRFTEKLSVA